MDAEVLVIGAGLSGLHTAWVLQKKGIDVQVLEARSRLGGRIYSPALAAPNAQVYADLGPTWFWQHQHRLHTLIDALGLQSRVFDQYASGSAVYEDAEGDRRVGVQGISMAGAYRLEGGLQALTSALAEQLVPGSIALQSGVTDITSSEADNCVYLSVGEAQRKLRSRYVVLALPPRVASASIHWQPELSPERQAELNSVSTWMAGHEKFLAVYETPFWRRDGLSGDAISHRGPLQEIHDASPMDESCGILFGFSGLPPAARIEHQATLRAHTLAQLTRLFGDSAATPIQVLAHDWAADSETATSLDQSLPTTHELEGLCETVEPGWLSRVIWSGTECAPASNQNMGFLEGALEASDAAVAQVVNHRVFGRG